MSKTVLLFLFFGLSFAGRETNEYFAQSLGKHLKKPNCNLEQVEKNLFTIVDNLELDYPKETQKDIKNGLLFLYEVIKRKSFLFKMNKYPKNQADTDTQKLVANINNGNISPSEFKDEFLKIANQCIVNNKQNIYGTNPNFLILKYKPLVMTPKKKEKNYDPVRKDIVDYFDELKSYQKGLKDPLLEIQKLVAKQIDIMSMDVSRNANDKVKRMLKAM